MTVKKTFALSGGGSLCISSGSVVDFSGDAIVNAANKFCLGGGGVDAMVSKTGGKLLAQARDNLPVISGIRCPPGEARITIGGDLNARFCIHAVGPDYKEEMREPNARSLAECDDLLSRAYMNAMKLAREKSLHSIGFALLSAGIFRGPQSLRNVLRIGINAISKSGYSALREAHLIAFTETELAELSAASDEIFSSSAITPAAPISAPAASISAPAPGTDWFSALFGFRETNYDTARRLLRVDFDETTQGTLITSLPSGQSFGAGTFTTPSLADLRESGAKVSLPGTLSFRNVIGDVSWKHAELENRFATFQVASQFNCLEFVSPNTLPEQGITCYVGDKTQGPACSIACGAATAFRNYFVRVDGEVQGQRQDRQIDNLFEVGQLLGNVPAGKLYQMKGGYVFATNDQLRQISRNLGKFEKANLVEDVRGALRIGLHSDVQVTSHGWGTTQLRYPRHVVTQVFGSACAVAYNRETNPANWESFASLVLEASYEATLWAGVLNAAKHSGAAGSRRVFLTSLGGGVFGNRDQWIDAAIRRALNRFKDFDLDVRIVNYAEPVPLWLRAIERDYFRERAPAAKLAVVERDEPALAPVPTPAPRPSFTPVAAPVLVPASAPVHVEFSRGTSAEESLAASSTSSLDVGKPVVTDPDSGRRKASEASSAPAVKRHRAHDARSAATAPGQTVEPAIWEEAKSLRYERELLNLAGREEVVASGASHRQMLDALRSTGGLVNASKRKLLGL